MLPRLLVCVKAASHLMSTSWYSAVSYGFFTPSTAGGDICGGFESEQKPVKTQKHQKLSRVLSVNGGLTE